jgi:hypothetical protein
MLENLLTFGSTEMTLILKLAMYLMGLLLIVKHRSKSAHWIYAFFGLGFMFLVYLQNLYFEFLVPLSYDESLFAQIFRFESLMFVLGNIFLLFWVMIHFSSQPTELATKIHPSVFVLLFFVSFGFYALYWLQRRSDAVKFVWNKAYMPALVLLWGILFFVFRDNVHFFDWDQWLVGALFFLAFTYYVFLLAQKVFEHLEIIPTAKHWIGLGFGSVFYLQFILYRLARAQGKAPVAMPQP